MLRKNDAKFNGTDEEFENRFPNCGHSTPWTDEEGFFSYWLCLKDCKVCNFQCKQQEIIMGGEWIIDAYLDWYYKDEIEESEEENGTDEENI